MTGIIQGRSIVLVEEFFCYDPFFVLSIFIAMGWGKQLHNPRAARDPTELRCCGDACSEPGRISSLPIPKGAVGIL